MFTDLVKGAKGAKSAKREMMDSEEISDERLDQIMSELFGQKQDEPESAKKGMGHKDRAKDALMRAMNDEDEEMSMEKGESDEEEEDLDEEDMEKGMSRRDMMDKVYSMVDDLSDEELSSFLSSREIKKAQAMMVFQQMSNSELRDLVSVDEANGARRMEPMKSPMSKGDGYGYGDERDDEV